MVHTYSGILLSLKKEGNLSISYTIDEPEDIMQSKVSSQEKTNAV